MSAVAKTRPIRFSFRPGTPRNILREVRSRYENFLVEDGEELVDVTETEWYRRTKASMTPADYLRHLREAQGLTLRELGARLEVSVQYLHDMEAGTRGIGKEKAKRLGELFNISPAVFI
jgi:DNA-binding transcriptional regulator YiaG